MTEQFPADVTVIKHQKFSDDRGHLNCLFETERQETFEGYSLKMSSSRQNVARGLHWQNWKAPQEKIITPLSGIILDVLLNVDAGSPRFGQAYRFVVSAEERISIVIPPHYAHGFLALTDVDFLYLCKGRYAAENEMSIHMLEFVADRIDTEQIVFSAKDARAPSFHSALHAFQSR